MAIKRDEAKYDAILSAAVEVMAESGYHHSQISRIARTAGVADGTVYLYFKNKEDILISLLRRTMERIIAQGERRMDAAMGARGRLHALVSLYLHEHAANPALSLVTQVHLRQVDAGIRIQIGDIMRPFTTTLDNLILQGIEEGLFRPNLNRRIARRMIFGTLDETVTAWVLTGSKYDLTSLIEDVVDVLANGLCRAEGVNADGSLSGLA